MPWKCPRCGFEDNPEASRNCDGGCGHVRFAKRVVLIACETNRQIVMSVDTTVDKHLLRSFAGDDAAYASSPQFRIYKDAALGGWALEHDAAAKNPTFCNGAAVSGGTVLLSDGCTVSIGPDRMQLVVRIED